MFSRVGFIWLSIGRGGRVVVNAVLNFRGCTKCTEYLDQPKNWSLCPMVVMDNLEIVWKERFVVLFVCLE